MRREKTKKKQKNPQLVLQRIRAWCHLFILQESRVFFSAFVFTKTLTSWCRISDLVATTFSEMISQIHVGV